MDDLISRQAAIDAIENIYPSVAWLDYAADVIKALPSAQLEIIRCKDCGHADWSGMPEGRIYCMVHEHYLSENDYCSYGVKEDE